MFVLTDHRLKEVLQRVLHNPAGNADTNNFCTMLLQALDETYNADKGEAALDTAVDAPDTDFPMPFGKYKGTVMSKVPKDYFHWLLKQDQPIKHPAVARWVRTHIQEATP